MRKILLSLLAILLPAFVLPARNLSVGNETFRSDLVFHSHRFAGAVFTDLQTGRVLTADTPAPLFELCIDGRTWTSSDPVWNYRGQSARSLVNGGTMVSFKFCGRGPLKGLTLVWDREVFPEDAFIRERLRLQSGGGKTLCLTNRDGANHLVFPRYAFAAEGPVQGKELRIGTFRKKRAFPEHHMFHPDSALFELGPAEQAVKGPFLILTDARHKWVTSYEHASQDQGFRIKRKVKNPDGLATEDGNDASQEVEGDLLELTDDGLWFIASFASVSDGSLVLGNRIRHGGYLDGEAIPSRDWYETVWSTLSILPSGGDENEAIAEYLLDRITENPESRVADFYYNSWGMQRASPDLYSVMNEERLREEIRYAAECGVQTFIIDDGWHETFGHWVGNPVRIPSGLRALTAYMDSLGIRPGIWLSLPGAGPKTERTREHPEWLIRDTRGELVLGQWKNPVYDIVGPYYDCLLDDLKALCDEGFRFFKWDAMNTLSSTLPGLYHGDDRYSERERADRYNYLLPFYVTRMMRELREYCPGTVVEIDLTEQDRCLVGLQVLQEGKYFFINNGAAWYNDYSNYRTRSVRTVINKYAEFMPQEIFTYAVYPHDQAGCQSYNLTTALTAGHGIWGDLSLMTPEQRARVKDLFGKGRQVLPHVRGSRVEVVGAVGDSPEIYLQRNAEEGFALLTAFSWEPVSLPFTIGVQPSAVLGVLNHPFRLCPEGVQLTLELQQEDCASAFVLGTGGETVPARVLSSTGKLDSVTLEGDALRVRAATDSEIEVQTADGRTQRYTLPAGKETLIR